VGPRDLRHWMRWLVDKSGLKFSLGYRAERKFRDRARGVYGPFRRASRDDAWVVCVFVETIVRWLKSKEPIVLVQTAREGFVIAFSDCQRKMCMTKQPCHDLRCARRRRGSHYSDAFDLGEPEGGSIRTSGQQSSGVAKVCQ
jgi:hypothetical protein